MVADPGITSAMRVLPLASGDRTVSRPAKAGGIFTPRNQDTSMPNTANCSTGIEPSERWAWRLTFLVIVLFAAAVIALLVVQYRTKVNKSEIVASAEVLLREAVPSLSDLESAATVQKIQRCIMDKTPNHVPLDDVEALRFDKTFMYPLLRSCLRDYVMTAPDLRSKRARNATLARLAPFRDTLPIHSGTL